MSRQGIALAKWYQNEETNIECKDLQIHVHQGLGARLGLDLLAWSSTTAPTNLITLG